MPNQMPFRDFAPHDRDLGFRLLNPVLAKISQPQTDRFTNGFSRMGLAHPDQRDVVR